MAVKEVVPGLWQVPLGYVNAFLFDTGDGLVLIDTGIPGSSPKILEAVRAIGREPAAIRHILVTYCHSDHAGSAAEMKRLTGAPATMHPTDAEMVRTGEASAHADSRAPQCLHLPVLCWIGADGDRAGRNRA